MKNQNNGLRFLTLLLILSIITSVFVSCDEEPFDPWDDKYFENQGDDFYEKHAVVTDSLGRTVAIKKKPNYVAALTGSLAEVWQLSGGEVFATTDDAWTELGLELRFDAVNLGGTHSINMRALYEQDPELVIASATAPDRFELMEALDKAGITSLFLDISSYDGYLNALNICTDITDHKGFYETYGTSLKEQIDTCKARMLELERAPRVLVLRASSTTLQVKGSKGTVMGEALSDLGCINVADIDESLTQGINLESIHSLQPDHIFVVFMGDDIEQAIINMSLSIGNEELWNQLDAVKNGKIHFMDKQRFSLKPNTKWAEAYEALTAILTSN